MNEDFDKSDLIVGAALAAGVLTAMVGGAFGFEWLALGGLLAASAALSARGSLSLETLRQNPKNAWKERIADLAEAHFAASQLLFGAAVFVLTVAEISAGYVSSGAFWQAVMATVPASVLILLFGLFLVSFGAAHIFSRLPHENNSLRARAQTLSDIAHGVFFLVFGLVFTGLALLVLIF